MSQLIGEQENNELIRSHSFTKNQISANKSVKVSSNKLLADINVANNKSSRKAFGNVSNVVAAAKSMNSAKKMVEKRVVNIDVKDSVKPILDVTHTHVSNTGKYFDAIENMDRITEQELSELNDPITADLFAIDDNIIYSQHFDDDITEHLISQKLTNDDIDDIF